MEPSQQKIAGGLGVDGIEIKYIKPLADVVNRLEAHEVCAVDRDGIEQTKTFHKRKLLSHSELKEWVEELSGEQVDAKEVHRRIFDVLDDDSVTLPPERYVPSGRENGTDLSFLTEQADTVDDLPDAEAVWTDDAPAGLLEGEQREALARMFAVRDDVRVKEDEVWVDYKAIMDANPELTYGQIKSDCYPAFETDRKPCIELNRPSDTYRAWRFNKSAMRTLFEPASDDP